MMWQKSCSRCQGDLFDAEDRFGRYIACAQCGHELTPAEEQAVLAHASRATATPPRAKRRLATAGR